MPSLDDAVAAVAGTPGTGTPAAAQPAKQDPIGDAVSAVIGAEQTQRRATMFDAVRVNPDQAAKARRLSAESGVPSEVALRNLQDLDLQLAVERYSKRLEQPDVSQTLRNYFTTSDFARLAHDDIDVLTGLDAQVQRFGTFGQWQGPAPTVGSVLYGLAASPGQGFAAARAGLQAQMSDTLDALGVAPMSDAVRADRLRKMAQASYAAEYTTPAFESGLAKGVYGGATSLLRQAPGMAMSIATRSPTPALVVLGMQTEAESYAKYRARGATPGQAAVGGLLEGGVEVATEKLPMKFLTETLGKAGMREFVTGLLAREIPSEQLATILQDATDTAIANPDKTWAQYLNERPGAAFETLVATVTQSALLGGISSVARRLSRDQTTLENSERDNAQLANMVAAASESKLRERAPGSFAEFVQSAAQNTEGAPTAVYVDARALTDALNQAGIPDEQLDSVLPSVRAQIEAAFDSGGVVEIPIGEALAAAPGTPLEQVLLQNARLDPEGLSQIEVDEANKQADQFIKAEAERIVADAQARVATEEQTAQIRQTIADQLNAAGRFRPEANDVYATMVGAFYNTTAQRLGITPAELYARYPLRVTGEVQADPELQQGAAPVAQVPYTDAEGGQYAITVTPQAFGAGQTTPNSVLVELRDAATGERRAFADFSVRDDGVLTSENTKVAPSFQKRGMAAAMYGAARQAGYDIAPGRVQTDQGLRMVESLQRQGLINKEAIGPRFQAGDLDLAQGARATFSPSQMLIALGPNADYSSFLHESGHAFLEILADMAVQRDAPAQVVQDWQTTLDWFGLTAGQWAGMTLDEKRKYHERWAESTEQYFFEGKAPSVELRGVFDRFRTWLTSVYKSLKQFIAARPNNDVALSDDIRAVMDRLLATDEQIADAERVRQYGLLFKSPEEAGMTPEQWAQYTSDDAKAHAQALADLTARNLRDFGIVSRKRIKALREVQRDMAEKRKPVEAEAADIIAKEPVYRAIRWLKKGEMLTDTGEEIKVADGFKMDRAAVDAIFPESMPGRPDLDKLRGMTIKKGGLSPDLVAEMFGYRDGAHLITSIVEAFPQQEQVQGLADQMMLERYGDMTTARGQERAADEAVHNEMRARVLAAEMAAVSQANNARAPGAGGRTTNALVAAAKQFAERVVEGRKIKDLKPQQFTGAETRAARAAEKALAKGDTQAVIAAKRDQLLNFHTARAVNEARTEAEKSRAFMRKIATAKDDVVGKTRDLDVVKAAQAVVGMLGIGERKAQSAVEYLAAVQTNDPAMYAALEPSLRAVQDIAKPFDELTVGELRLVDEELQALWYMAKRSRQMEVNGNLMDIEDAADDIKARLITIGIPETVPGDTSAITPAEQRALKLRGFLAAARRVESWAQAKDGDDRRGPFRRLVWEPVREAADAYRVDKAKYLKQFKDLLAPIESTLTKRTIEAPELGYVFGRDTDGVALAEILHAVLHTGNESNKRKMLIGREDTVNGGNWGALNPDGTLDSSKWDAFVRRMVAEGVLRPEHFDFAQGVWDLLESTKPMAQKTHREVFGKYFAEVTADKFTDPFGVERRGGYIPAQGDARVIKDQALRKLMEDENASMQFAFPTTSKGFTKSRVENYNRPLLLDLRSLTQHIDKVLLFAHMEGHVRDVRKLLTHKSVSYGLNRIDPVAFDAILTPWLNRAAKQQVETPLAGDFGAMHFFSGLRRRAGMAAMFGNVANALQQVAGFSMAAVRVPPSYLAKAAVQYTAGPREMAAGVASMSDYMAVRMGDQVANMSDAINDILINPNVYQKSVSFLQRHAYFLQQGVDNVMGPIIWTGAYNQALERGYEARDAVRYADSAVRETQGSTAPEDVSRIETGNAFVRLFTQFAGYFNMQANLLGTEMVAIPQELGLRKGLGRGLYVLMFGFLINAWVAEAIMQLFKGGPDDEDKDGDYLDDWLAQVFGWSLLRNATAMVPAAGQIGTLALNMMDNKPNNDRLGTSPGISMIESSLRAGVDAYKIVTDKEVKPSSVIRDVATLISLVTGAPANAFAKPAGYAADVAADRVEPTSAADAVRGAVTGVASPESKRQ